MSDTSGEADYGEDMPEQDATIAGRLDLQPDTQGDEPLDAELGEDGQGDLGEGDERQHSGDGPDDLRTAGPSGDVREDRS